MLMKEVLYVISGKRLPIVFHVGARALTSQALNIHAGHDDVDGRRRHRLGHPLRSQRAGGGRPDRHRAPRRRGEPDPFLVCQDGFLTTHTLENARLPEDELLRAVRG